jgi:hypothetical protein
MNKEQRKRQQAGIRRKSANAAKIWESRKAEILWLYNDQNWSTTKMAEYFEVSQAGMCKAMKRLGIQSRGRGRAGSQNGRFKDGSQSRMYRKMITKDKCRKCGTVEDLGIHHKNDDHYDNRLENLEVLCNPCHMSITKRKWWKAKKAGIKLPKSNGPVGWS